MNIYFWGLKDGYVNDIIDLFLKNNIRNVTFNKINFVEEMKVDVEKKKVLFCVPEFSYGDVNGIAFTESTRREYKNIIIIFLSQNNMSIVSVMKKHIYPAGYFLMNEINDAVQFLINVLEAEKRSDNSNELSMEIISRYEKVTIPISNVVYFVACNKKIVCKLSNGESVEFYGTLAQIEKEYKNIFLRTHAGYLVNKRKILLINFTKNLISVQNDEMVPISRKYRSDIKIYADSYFYKNMEKNVEREKCLL